MIKNIIKSLIFVIIFIILFIMVSKIFVRKGNGYGSDVLSFYNEPRNSLDIVFFGSSHSYSTFNPFVIKEKINMTSYNFSTQQQPFWITYHYMKETLKYQKPKYFVLEILMSSIDYDYATEGVNRDAIDKMRMSINKIDAINISVENKNERLSYYLNLIKYHNRWNELIKTNFIDVLTINISNNKGFTFLEKKNIHVSKVNISDVKQTKSLTQKNLLYLNKMIELAKENNIALIFTKTPCSMTKEKQMYYNTVKKIADDNNIEFIDYNLLYNQIGIDFNNDFYDSGHLNGYGAKKVSIHFANYINNLNSKK